LVIGGSKLYTGAPILVAKAALASGCDLVTIVAPQRVSNTAARDPNLITYPLKGDYITKKHLSEIKKLTKGKSAVVVGNGLGRNKGTMNFVKSFVKKTNLPMVIDADALHAVKGKLKKNIILTPHAGEFFALTGIRAKNNTEERKKIVKKAAKSFGCVIFLKGASDVISDGKRIAVDKEGNPYMTKGGTGDVLAGTAGSMLAQKIDPFDAACIAAHLTGVAGNNISKRKRQALLATDLFDEIAMILKKNN
jgi:NAD(P)H-hydrate epimerase